MPPRYRVKLAGVLRPSPTRIRRRIERDGVDPRLDRARGDRIGADQQAADEPTWTNVAVGNRVGRDIDAPSPQSFPPFRS